MSDSENRLVADAYSEIAPYYARLWQPVLLPLGRQLLDRLPLATARRVLDLGTGSGTLIDDIAEDAPAATVIAVDLAEGMLRVARQSHIASYAATNALAIPLADGSIDVVVSSFVLFNIPDPPAAMREIARVLRPGGSFGMTTWGHAPDDPRMAIWDEELDALGAPKDTWATEGREAINTSGKLAGLLKEAGFASPTVWTDDLAHPWRPDDWLEFFRHGRRRERLDAIPDDARDRCLARVRERLGELAPEQMIERAEVIFATATR